MVKKTDKAARNQRLRNQRLLNSWTQSQVAEKTGTTVVNVNRWEMGGITPSLNYRQKLCELFGKSAEELGLLSDEEKLELVPAASPILPALWTMPFSRNPFFTGREEVLRRLRSALEEEKVAAVAQPQAISGLGGIGKTQTAVEYAYRYRGRYQAVLWARADSREMLIADYTNLAVLLNLPEKDEQDQNRVVAGVKRWLKEHADWLLILDNTEDLELASDFLPPSGYGHVLLTTRVQSTATVAQRIELERMEPEEGAWFLLRRTRRIPPDATLEQATPADRATALLLSQIMEGLPLALDQAAAYIDETECGLAGYLSRYKMRRAHLLSQRGESVVDHPQSVATTWSLSFEKVQQANPAAADLLRLCAFLNPDAIPEEIFTEGAPEPGSVLEPFADLLKLDTAIRELRKFSLLRRDPDAQMLMMHRLVQDILKHSMDQDTTQRSWAERAVRAVSRVFPDGQFETWARCQRCVPQVQACATLIEQWHITFAEAASVLARAGYYLWIRGQFALSELLQKQTLDIRKETLGLHHPDVAQSMSNLALVYSDQGKYDQAEPLYQQALAICENSLGPEHPDVARNLNNLAELYREQGKYDQAEPLYQRAQAILEKAEGAESLRVGFILSNRAAIYLAWHEHNQAKLLLRQALEIGKKVLDPDDPALATLFSNLAELYCLEGLYEEAEPLYLQTLAIREQTLGQEHPYVAQNLNNLGEIYEKQEKYNLAETYYQRASRTYEHIGALEHPDRATVLENYASLLRRMHRAVEAENLENQAKAIRDKHTNESTEKKE